MSILVSSSGNSCRCTPTVTSVTSDPCDNCVVAASIVTDCVNSTPPCGASGTLDLTLYNNYDGCVDGNGDACTLSYFIISYDATNLTNVAISAGGELSWDTLSESVPSAFAEVRYKVQCDCNTLSSEATVQICIRDLCEGVICGQDEECNVCNGNCDPSTPDIEIT